MADVAPLNCPHFLARPPFKTSNLFKFLGSQRSIGYINLRVLGIEEFLLNGDFKVSSDSFALMKVSGINPLAKVF
jgi:hypothetical protein